MVTPLLSGVMANVGHARHEMYARTCVVAYWRCMTTTDRYDLLASLDRVDPRCVGATVFERGTIHAGARPSDLDRYIGIRDLVKTFEVEKRRREMRWRVDSATGQVVYDIVTHEGRYWKYNWPMALMEMIVDPVLVEWVPAYVVEQYKRWNPYFAQSLREVLLSDECKDYCNRHLLLRVKILMEEKRKAADEEKREEPDPDGASSESADSQEPGSDHENDVGDSVRDVIIRDERPGCGGDAVEAEGGDTTWGSLSREEQLSSARPAVEAPPNQRTSDPVLAAELAGLVNPEGYDWFSRSLAPPSRIDALRAIEKEYNTRIKHPDEDLGVEETTELDAWQEFAVRISDERALLRERELEQGVVSPSKPLRLILTGTAGTGKSLTVRAMVIGYGRRFFYQR